jgi:ribosomal protein L40E
MVSKEQYYARKEAGLCTKCGKSREGSPSKARCLACHTKLKARENKKTNPAEHQEHREGGNKEKPDISDKVKNLKKNTVIDTVNQKICQRCGGDLPTFNLICQKCLKTTVFTKYDAIARYDSKCDTCLSNQTSDLKIVSSDIGLPMKQKDQELFKLICYRRIAPPQYKVLCYSCYWKENMAHLKHMRQVFDQQGIFDESFMGDDDEVLDV